MITADESGFLHDYRQGGLEALQLAFMSAFASYIAFSVLAYASGGSFWDSVVPRLLPLACISIVLTLIRLFRRLLLARYTLLLSILSLATFFAIAFSSSLAQSIQSTQYSAPTILIALMVLYAFMRLPLRNAIVIGLLGSFASLLVGTRVTDLPNPSLRTILYLVIANVLGILFARSIELRERKLYGQRRRAEAMQHELERRTQIAEDASAEKSRSLAAIGHDLRQPMMAARIQASLVSDRASRDDLTGVRSQSEEVQKSLAVLNEMLEHLVNSVRTADGPYRAEYREVSILKCLSTLTETIAPQANVGKIEIRVRVPKQEIIVLTDIHMLLRVLINIASNAIKFSRKEPGLTSFILLRASTSRGACHLDIVDNGRGIESEHLEQIWLPFFQSNGGPVDREGGVGLGLHIVRQAIGRLEGHDIRVASRLGRWTFFRLTLPAVSSKPEAGATGAMPDEVDDAESRRYDLLDDGDRLSIAGMYALLLHDDPTGHSVLEGELDALGVLYSSSIDWIDLVEQLAATDRIADVVLCSVDSQGLREVLESIKRIRGALQYNAAAIVVTARAAELTAELSAELAADRAPKSTADLTNRDQGVEDIVIVRTPIESEQMAELLRAALRRSLALEARAAEQ